MLSNVIFDPLNLDAQTIASDLGLSLALGGSIPVEEIFEIESAVGGVFKDDFHIVIDPFAQDEQGDLTKFLKIQEPCKTALKDRINKTKETFIIAGRVFRAKIRGEVNFEISGELDANGEIRIADRMKDIIGGDIKLTVTGVGHLATIHSVRSPDVQSVAVVSATLDTETLARIYLKLRDNVQGRELENLVEQYVHERDPGVLLQTSARIENLLREAQLFYSDMLELYKSVFGGDGAQPVDLRELGPDEEWEAFGLVASANLIAQANR